MNITDKLAEALRLAMDWNWLDEDARPSDVAVKCAAALAEYDAASSSGDALTPLAWLCPTCGAAVGGGCSACSFCGYSPGAGGRG